MSKVLDLSQKLNINWIANGVSKYGRVGNVNIRVSDHLPKWHNMVENAERLVEDEDGVVKILIVVFSDDMDDQFDLEHELMEDLEEELDKEVSLKIYVENGDFSQPIFDMMYKTL